MRKPATFKIYVFLKWFKLYPVKQYISKYSLFSRSNFYNPLSHSISLVFSRQRHFRISLYFRSFCISCEKIKKLIYFPSVYWKILRPRKNMIIRTCLLIGSYVPYVGMSSNRIALRQKLSLYSTQTANWVCEDSKAPSSLKLSITPR